MNHCFYEDLFAELIGRSLLEYFDRKQFSKRLLQDPILNLLYFKAQVNNFSTDPSLSDVEREGLILHAHDIYCENGGKPFPTGKFPSSGVEK